MAEKLIATPKYIIFKVYVVFLVCPFLDYSSNFVYLMYPSTVWGSSDGAIHRASIMRINEMYAHYQVWGL